MLELKKGLEIEGRYVVHEHIGSGGFGMVWRASDKQLGRDVALKRLLKSGGTPLGTEAQAVLEEARKHAQIVHTNVVQVYDVLAVGGEHLIVMEYVNGESLQNQLRILARKGEVLPLDRAVSILKDTLSGIAFAHERKTIHRDLSPANILLTQGGIPKIADFGIARVLPQDGSTPSGSKGIQGGTGNPNFMAPEQARGEAADFGSDLFMVGIIGYLLLTGRHPFAHASGLFQIPELLTDQNFSPDAPRAPSVLGVTQQKLFREYAAVVMRLLHREKAGRFQTAREAIEALEAVEPMSDCPECGERVPDHYSFCGFCGTQMSEPASEPVAAPAATVVAAGKEDPDELVDRGFRASRLRRWWDATDLYRRAIRIDPQHSLAHRNLAYALNRVGRYDEAEEVASTALGFKGQSRAQEISLLLERGYARSNLKKYDDALQDVNDVLAQQPKSVRALYSRSRIHLFSGRIRDALVDAREVLKYEPDHNGALRILAQAESAA